MTRPWVVADYPSKRGLSRAEAMRVLRSGPNLEWFFPWAVLGEVHTDQPNRMPYGVAHWYYDAAGSPQHTVHTFQGEEDARWALAHLYRNYQEGCRCVAVFYWTPTMVNYSLEAKK